MRNGKRDRALAGAFAEAADAHLLVGGENGSSPIEILVLVAIERISAYRAHLGHCFLHLLGSVRFRPVPNDKHGVYLAIKLNHYPRAR